MAVRRADLRDAGGGACDFGVWPARAADGTCRLRTGGSLCASKIPDAQAAYESAQTLCLRPLLAGANFVLHAAGWLEGGLAASYEKFVMDFDQLGAMHVLAKGVDFSDNGQAMEAFHQVEPGGAFSRLRPHPSEFRDRLLSLQYRRQQFGRAVAGGGLEGRRDAGERLMEIDVAEYEPPPLDPAKDEAIRAFIDQRKASMADANY